MFDYFRTYSASNAHPVCCEESPTKSLYDHCHSDDLGFQSRSQVRLKLDYFVTCGHYLSNIQSWHDDRLVHGLELDLDFGNVCKPCPHCYFFFWTFLSRWEYSHEKFGSLSPRKASCDRVALYPTLINS